MRMGNRAECDGCLPIMTMEIGMGTEEILYTHENRLHLCYVMTTNGPQVLVVVNSRNTSITAFLSFVTPPKDSLNLKVILETPN